MKKYFFFCSLALLGILSSCSDDDDALVGFTVSFSSSSVSLSETDSSQEITLSFSRAATETGNITVSYTGTNAVYGTDFTTSPAGSNGIITVPVTVGDSNVAITFNKLTDPIEGSSKSVELTLNGYDRTDWANGTNAASMVSFTPIVSTGGVVNVAQGGDNQPNQVYVDLSSNTQTAVRRDAWEIAFYNGAENRVYLNSSLLVSAAELEGMTDLLSVTETSALTSPLELNSFDAQFAPITVTATTLGDLVAGLPVAYPIYGNVTEDLVFTDTAEGTLDGTAFEAVSTSAEENNVYLVSLGNEIPAEAANPGEINTTGDHRGILKVRVLTDGSSYTIQYADLNETENLTEVTVQKDDRYNLTAFSLTEGRPVSVEPTADAWDLNFSGVFSYYGVASFGGPPTTAGLTYSDYVLHNTLGNVGLYQVTIMDDSDTPSYADFSSSDIDESAFVYNDRTVIGSGWRSVFGVAAVKDDRYFIIKDADDNYFKLRFTAFTNSEGERGYPQFTYERL